MRHRCRGDKVEHAIEHAQARTQDGDHNRLQARDGFALAGGDGRFDGNRLRGKVLGCLVCFKHRKLAHRLTEDHIGGALVANDGKLVLNQRMIDNRDAFVALEIHVTSP